MKLLAFMVTFDRVRMLKDAVSSALLALPDDAQLFVLVNGRDKDSTHFLEQVIDSRLSWRVVAREPRAIARNRAFDFIDYDIIHFLDDDVIVPQHLFRKVVQHFRDDVQLSVVGGPNLTPFNSSAKEQAFGEVMASPFAAPRISQRYRKGTYKKSLVDETAFILCNLAVRRALVPPSVRFVEMRSNEENLLLSELALNQRVALYDPECHVYHRRRERLSSFVRQVASYGFGRAEQSLKRFSIRDSIFLVPAIVLLVTPILILFWFELFVVLCGLYGLLSLWSATAGFDTNVNGFRRVLTRTALTPMVHVSYGAGFWLAIYLKIKMWFRASFSHVFGKVEALAR